MCFRTLDLYTSAVLESTLNPVIPPKQEFRHAMDAMAKVGLALQCMAAAEHQGPLSFKGLRVC